MSNKSIQSLKATAEQLGIAPYASNFGDRRKKSTWMKLLSSSNLTPLKPRENEQSHQSINVKFAIVLFIGAVALLCLLKPLLYKALPVRITITIGAK